MTKPFENSLFERLLVANVTSSFSHDVSAVNIIAKIKITFFLNN